MAHDGNVGRRHQGLAGQLAGPVQVRLQVVNLNINREVIVGLVAQGGYMALDAQVLPGGDPSRPDRVAQSSSRTTWCKTPAFWGNFDTRSQNARPAGP